MVAFELFNLTEKYAISFLVGSGNEIEKYGSRVVGYTSLISEIFNSLSQLKDMRTHEFS